MRINPSVKFPPGGWIYFQPEIGWNAPLPLAHDRYQTARDIVAVRRANPHKNLSTDEAAALADLETYTAYRLKMDPHYVIGGDVDVQKKSPVTAAAPIIRPVLKRIAQLAVGIETFREWLGDGLTPVPFGLASGRSNVCEACPMNVRGDWLNRASGAVADKIKKHVAAKERLNLTVPNEGELGTCSACECSLPLKIWVPINVIDMSAETLARLHHACWILSEKKAMGNPALP